MIQRSRRASRFEPRSVVGVLALAGAIVLLVLATRPSPRNTLEAHWSIFGTFALGAVALMLIALAACARRYRWIVAGISIVALVVAALAHPVCVPIPKGDQSSFEQVTSLEERARQGEPFCRFGAEWYQCKSFVSRALFF